MRKFILTLTVLSLSALAFAAPPHPDLLEKIKQGEVRVPAHNLTISDAELSRLGFDPARLKAAPLAKSGAVSGPFRVLVILVDFSDKNSQVAPVFFDSLVFAQTQSSVRRFYAENSYGVLDLVTVNYPSSTGWQRAPQTSVWYADSQYGIYGAYPQNAQKLVEEVVDLVNPIVNFASYDNDGDSFVDGLAVVHSGRGAEFTGNVNDIWSHKWAITPKAVDGVFVFDYNMEPEYWSSPGDMTIGVFCHEFGHSFGLPDLYDIDGGSQGIGRWSVMAGGTWNGVLGNSPAHFDAWCKTELGFAVAGVIASNQTGVKIPNSQESNAGIFRLWTNGTLGQEYYLVENRKRTGYDAALPAAGLLVWHIDESRTTNSTPWFPPNNPAAGRYKVALVQADNLWQMEQNINSGNAGDPYPGTTANRNFNSSTGPNSNGYNGANSLVQVLNVSNSGDTMTADLFVAVPTGVDDGYNRPRDFQLAQNYPNPFNPATTISYALEKSGNVELEVYNLLGQKIKTLFSGSQKAGNHQIDWDGTDRSGRFVSSGLYFYRLETESSAEVKKMMLVR